jgi:hypothetical protein
METDGTIVLRLQAQGLGGLIGDAVLKYPPGHPEYQNILRHLGGLKNGEVKQVLPWHDPIGGSSMEHVNQKYEGFILIQPGLESRVFKRDLDQREFYWVDYGPGVNTEQISNNMVKLDEVTLAVWVQVEGDMEEGHFGHSNQYEKRLLVRKLINCSPGPVEQYRAKHKG